jgi:hypothetical protein
VPPKPQEREHYRDEHRFGVDTWVRFKHPDVPAGYEVERVTTHQIVCTRCDRYRITWAVWDDMPPAEQFICPNCD